METIAQAVYNCINSHNWAAFSLHAGYGLSNGKTIRFKGGVLLKERRNDVGRVTYALYSYADNSQLEYKYSDNHGMKITVVK